MARIGLGDRWQCLFANDISAKKGASYLSNFTNGRGVLRISDVSHLKTTDLPGYTDLVWGSFPCQDLSLAGNGLGLHGNKSKASWPFWDLIRKLKSQGRGPGVIVLENVTGTLTSHKGLDFEAIVSTIVGSGYKIRAVTVDAAWFLPQSRPRLFL